MFTAKAWSRALTPGPRAPSFTVERGPASAAKLGVAFALTARVLLPATDPAIGSWTLNTDSSR
jgi:hypothetical protein